jgi:hypothetical protein
MDMIFLIMLLFAGIGVTTCMILIVTSYLTRGFRYRKDIINLEEILAEAPDDSKFNYCLGEFRWLARNNRDIDRTYRAWKKFTRTYRDFCLKLSDGADPGGKRFILPRNLSGRRA